MKALIIGSVIIIASGIGIYSLGGLNVLLLSILIPLFLFAPLLIFVASAVIGAIDGVGDLVNGLKDTVNNFTGPNSTTVNAEYRTTN